MADRVVSGKGNLKGLMQNSNMMEHASMYPNKLKKASSSHQAANASVNTMANQKSKVVGKNATT